MKAPLTPQEAAHALGCSRSKVYALIANGQLAAYRFERSLRIECAAVEAFKAAHRVRVEAPEPVGASPRVVMPPASDLGTDRYV